jgi:hypothetical protein
MTRQVSKPNIFWAPSLETARKIDDEDTVTSIETARARVTQLAEKLLEDDRDAIVRAVTAGRPA